jgi:hypothetical protein
MTDSVWLVWSPTVPERPPAVRKCGHVTTGANFRDETLFNEVNELREMPETDQFRERFFQNSLW